MKVDFKVSADAAGQRLDKFLRKRLDNLPLSHLYKLVRTKKVRVNGARAAIAQLLQPGDEITVHVLQAAQAPPPKPAAAVRQDFKVLYEDEHILAVEKPAGLAIHPGSGISGETLMQRLGFHYLDIPQEGSSGIAMRYREMSLPHWFVAACLLILPGWWVILKRKQRRKRDEQRTPS